VSAVDILVDYVKSGELVRLLAAAKELTIDQVYDEVGRVCQEALCSYIPALDAMVQLCKITPGCESRLVSLRTSLIRDICELVGLNHVIQWILDILHEIPQWLIDALKDVADVWELLDEYSRGKFDIVRTLQVCAVLIKHYGAQILKGAEWLGKEILSLASAVGKGVLWVAGANAYAQAYLIDQTKEIADTIREVGTGAASALLRDAGLGPVADLVDSASSLVGELEDTALDTGKAIICVGGLIC